MVVVQQVVLGVDKMDRAVAFWCGLLGYRPVESRQGPRWTTLAPTHGDGIRIGLQLSTAVVHEFPRVHLDLAATSQAEVLRLADRAQELGGARVHWPLYPADPDFVVLADSEGNRFCVVDLGHSTSAAGDEPERALAADPPDGR